MNTRMRHVLAFVGVSALAGPAWWGALALLPWTRDLVRQPQLGPMGLEHPREVMVAFSLTTLLVAGLLRRLILSRSLELLPVSMFGLALGGLVFLWVTLVLGIALGHVTAPTPSELGSELLAIPVFPLLGVLIAALSLPVSIPLACALVWLMRKVGGVRTEPTPAHP